MLTKFATLTCKGCIEIFEEKNSLKYGQKKIKHLNTGKISQLKLIINLLTIYDYSSLQDCKTILEENFHYSKYTK